MNNRDSHNGERPWQVVVPATSANLGCAFDCAGLALKLYLKARLVPSDRAGLDLEYRGADVGRVPLDDSNLLHQAFRLPLKHFNVPLPQGRIQIESEIPVGVGLGSSAAAIVAGLLLGSHYCGHDVDAQQLLRWACELEGHVDNAAAACHGGLVFSLSMNSERIVTLKTEFPEDIMLVIVTPSVAIPTQQARHALPRSYSRTDVVHTLQRAALLAATCCSGKFDLFPELFDDRLHQPFRRELVPGITQCLRYRHEGLLGVAISGAGSSVIAFTRSNHGRIARDLQQTFREQGVETQVIFTSAENHGAVSNDVSSSPVASIEAGKL
jgi:homoserine kinase